MLAKVKSVRVHQKNLQLLATEVFESKTGMPHELMNDILHFVESPYSLRSKYTLERNRNYTTYHTQRVFFPGSEIMGSSTKLLRTILCLSKNPKQKLIVWTGSTTVLAKY